MQYHMLIRISCKRAVQCHSINYTRILKTRSIIIQSYIPNTASHVIVLSLIVQLFGAATSAGIELKPTQ